MLIPRNLIAADTVGPVCVPAVPSAHAQAAPNTKLATDVASPGKGKEGNVKLADSSIEYCSRGEGKAIVLPPGGTLSLGKVDGLDEALAKGAAIAWLPTTSEDPARAQCRATESRSRRLPMMQKASSRL